MQTEIKDEEKKDMIRTVRIGSSMYVRIPSKILKSKKLGPQDFLVISAAGMAKLLHVAKIVIEDEQIND